MLFFLFVILPAAALGFYLAFALLGFLLGCIGWLFYGIIHQWDMLRWRRKQRREAATRAAASPL